MILDSCIGGKFSEAFVLWFAGKLDPNDYHGKPAAIPCPGENFTQEKLNIFFVLILNCMKFRLDVQK